MKDGTTHLAYKEEQTVDLKTDMILSASLSCRSRRREDDRGHGATRKRESPGIRQHGASGDVVADKGYHSAETITTFAEETLYRTYIPEPRQPVGQTRIWTDKPPGTTRRGLCQPSTDSRPTW